MIPVNYKTIHDYYQFQFGRWLEFVKPLGIAAAACLGAGVLLGFFSTELRGVGFFLALLMGLGAAACVYIGNKEHRDFQTLTEQFNLQAEQAIINEKTASRDALGNIEYRDIPPFVETRPTDFPLPTPGDPLYRTVWGTEPHLWAAPNEGRTFSSIQMKTLYCSQGWIHGVEEVFDLRQSYREYQGNIQWALREVTVSFHTVSSSRGHEVALVVTNAGETWSIYLDNSPEQIAHISALQNLVRQSRSSNTN